MSSGLAVHGVHHEKDDETFANAWGTLKRARKV
jgi:hypothetical protein